MRKVSLERYYFVLRWCSYFKKCHKWRLTRFAIKFFKSKADWYDYKINYDTYFNQIQILYDIFNY